MTVTEKCSYCDKLPIYVSIDSRDRYPDSPSMNYCCEDHIADLFNISTFFPTETEKTAYHLVYKIHHEN